MLRATFNSYGDRHISHPYKINTPEPIDKKFGTVDYIREGTLYTKFDTNAPTGGFWANWGLLGKWVKYNKKLFFIYTFFLRHAHRSDPWMNFYTRDSSKDVKSRKDVPFGGLNNVPINFGGKLPKNSNFGGVNRTFKPERQKISNPYNLKTTDPIMTKFLQGVRTASVPSWVVP